jgi:hypothetical protein
MVDSKKLAPGAGAAQLRHEVLEPWDISTRRLLAVPPIEPADAKAARHLAVFKAFAQARGEAMQKTVVAMEQPTEEGDAASKARGACAKTAWNAGPLDSGKR